MLKNQKGFTLIEMITVIVVLGIILGIGLPRYAIMQAQAEWDADVATLQNFGKMAEVLYAVDKTAGTPVTDAEGTFVLMWAEFLHKAGLFDGGTVLNRIREGLKTGEDDNFKSIRNTEKLPLYTEVVGDPEHDVCVQINPETGKVRWDDWYEWFIGKRPGS